MSEPKFIILHDFDNKEILVDSNSILYAKNLNHYFNSICKETKSEIGLQDDIKLFVRETVVEITKIIRERDDNMLKFHLMNGKFIIGLDREDMEELLKGQQIIIKEDEVRPGKGDIVIMGGETSQDIWNEVKKNTQE